MTVANSAIRRFILVGAILVFVVGGLGCSWEFLFQPQAIAQINLSITKVGTGSGSVISSDITSTSPNTFRLNCPPSTLDSGDPCSVTYENTVGTVTFFATSEPGSELSSFSGFCNPVEEFNSPCSVEQLADNQLKFSYNSEPAVISEPTSTFFFGATVRFDTETTPPPLPSELIAFESTRDGNSEIYTINPDGTGRARVTTNAAEDREPVWSPDRSRFAIATDRDGNDEIYTILTDGSNPVRVTNLAGSDRRPVFSPDGTRIAFDDDGDGDDEIFVTNADGTGIPTQLTSNTVDFDQGPSWSPNAPEILFTSFRDGKDNLYVMNPDGSGQVLLVDTGQHDFQPDWSPDGTRIVFTQQSLIPGRNNIFVVNADGVTGLLQLTFSDEAQDPTWSPDGNWIAFSSGFFGNRDIYIMTATGQNVTQVTTDPADDFRPSWAH